MIGRSLSLGSLSSRLVFLPLTLKRKSLIPLAPYQSELRSPTVIIFERFLQAFDLGDPVIRDHEKWDPRAYVVVKDVSGSIVASKVSACTPTGQLAGLATSDRTLQRVNSGLCTTTQES